MALRGGDVELDRSSSTDAMQFAARVGVSLAEISDRCDADPMVGGSRPRVMAADPARRATRLHTRFADVMAADPATPVVVPVVPNRRRAGDPAVVDPAVLEALSTAGTAGLAAAAGPHTQVLSASLATVLVEPLTHARHRSHLRCSRSQDQRCWRSCAEQVCFEVSELAAALPGWPTSREWVCPPLLPAPPAGVPRRVVLDTLELIDAELAGVVAFAPHPIALRR